MPVQSLSALDSMLFSMLSPIHFFVASHNFNNNHLWVICSRCHSPTRPQENYIGLALLFNVADQHCKQAKSFWEHFICCTVNYKKSLVVESYFCLKIFLRGKKLMFKSFWKFKMYVIMKNGLQCLCLRRNRVEVRKIVQNSQKTNFCWQKMALNIRTHSFIPSLRSVVKSITLDVSKLTHSVFLCKMYDTSK